MTCVLKDGDKFYPQLFLKEACVVNKHNSRMVGMLLTGK